jgi:tRNA (mo5U34)-methyltransferase
MHHTIDYARHHDLLRQASALVSQGQFAAAADVMTNIETPDARARYSMGICQFAAGDRDAGLENIRVGLLANPGLLPYWPLTNIGDVLHGISDALGDSSPTCQLSVTLAISAIHLSQGRTPEGVEACVDIIRRLRPVDLLSTSTDQTETDVRASVAPQPIWHSMDLGSSFIEGRTKPARILAAELLRFDLPDVRHKSVLDIGAWDGFFSFECERRGASHVTALDYHSWVTDLAALQTFASAYRQEHKVTPDLYAPPEHMRDESSLPGRRAFDVARRLLGSHVKPFCRDFRDLSPAELGQFDVTLFLGVLYHLTDPFGALEKVYALTREVAVIETQGFHDPGATTRPLWEFYKDDRINNDPTTWWAPNECALRDMLEAVGFEKVEIKSGASTLALPALSKPSPVRIVAHAWR